MIEIRIRDWTYLSLEKGTPSGRALEHRPESGRAVVLARLGGLHHCYEWREAAWRKDGGDLDLGEGL